MQKSEQVTSLCVPGDSEGDEEETTQDEVSSHTSEEDGGVVKVEKELENAEQPVGGKKVAEHEASDKWLLGTLPLLLCPDASPPPEATLASEGLPGFQTQPLFFYSTRYPTLRHIVLITPSLPYPPAHISLYPHTAPTPKAPHFFLAECPSL